MDTAAAGVTAVTKTSSTVVEARLLVQEMHDKYGSWRKVADLLAHDYPASAALWWKLARGKSQNMLALDAMLRFCGLPSLAPKRNRGSLFVGDMNDRRRRLGVTWRQVVEIGLETLEKST